MSDLSTCCKAPVKVEGGMPEDGDEGKTRFYVCEKCGAVTDLLNLEDWGSER